jgi:hypothetical protein
VRLLWSNILTGECLVRYTGDNTFVEKNVLSMLPFFASLEDVMSHPCSNDHHEGVSEDASVCSGAELCKEMNGRC